MSDFQTPDWVCRLMVRRIPIGAKTILEPTPGDGNLVRAIQSQFPDSIVYDPVHFGKFPYHGVDCIVANPPFTPMQTGYQLLETFFGLSNNIIILMPWLALINSEKRTKTYMEHGLKQVIHLPRSAFPGARVQTCILVFEGGYPGVVTFQVAEKWCDCGDELRTDEDIKTGTCWICRSLGR